MGGHLCSAPTAMATRSSAPQATSAVATPVLVRMMFAARMSWGTVSHARGMVVVVAEMHATHQAASAASHLGWRKPGGTQSPRPPSALGEQGSEQRCNVLQCLHG